jgi:hypothetical protein
MSIILYLWTVTSCIIRRQVHLHPVVHYLSPLIRTLRQYFPTPATVLILHYMKHYVNKCSVIFEDYFHTTFEDLKLVVYSDTSTSQYCASVMFLLVILGVLLWRKIYITFREIHSNYLIKAEMGVPQHSDLIRLVSLFKVEN